MYDGHYLGQRCGTWVQLNQQQTWFSTFRTHTYGAAPSQQDQQSASRLVLFSVEAHEGKPTRHIQPILQYKYNRSSSPGLLIHSSSILQRTAYHKFNMNNLDIKGACN